MKKRIYYIPSYEVDVQEKPKFTWKQFWKNFKASIIPLSVFALAITLIIIAIYYILVFISFILK